LARNCDFENTANADERSPSRAACVFSTLANYTFVLRLDPVVGQDPTEPRRRQLLFAHRHKIDNQQAIDLFQLGAKHPTAENG
jgi:hypothetical protein